MKVVVVYRGREDITPILDVAEKYGYHVVVKESDEFFAIGSFGFVDDVNTTTALMIRWAERGV